MKRFYSPVFILLLGILCFFESCTSPKEFVYFNDINQLKDTLLGAVKYPGDITIKSKDLLEIRVSALNPDDVQMFNAAISSAAKVGAGQGTFDASDGSGYLVDDNGYIVLPYVGEIKVSGMTLKEVEKYLVDRLKKFVKEPVASVRFNNHWITVLGDISQPKQIEMNVEPLSIIDVLARTGDLKLTAYRNNILVIREINGVRTTGRINLLSKDVFNSPYFYLKNRDILYVEPVKGLYLARSDFRIQGLNTVLQMLFSVVNIYFFVTQIR